MPTRLEIVTLGASQGQENARGAMVEGNCADWNGTAVLLRREGFFRGESGAGFHFSQLA